MAKSSKRSKRGALLNHGRSFFLLTILAFPVVYTFNYFKRFPVTLPYVDDWILVPWISGNAESNIKNWFSLLNGHQHAPYKFMLVILGKIDQSPYSYIGFFGLFFTSFAAFLLMRYLNFRIPGKSTTYIFFAYATLALLCLTPRTYQNYFMVICLPWSISFFLVILYALNLQGKNSLSKVTYIACLASFVNALGTSLLIFHIVLTAYISLRKRELLLKSQLISWACFTTSVVIPSRWSDSASILELSKGGNLREFSGFFLALLGQPIIPYDYSKANLAGIIGFGILVFVIYLLQRGGTEILSPQFALMMTGLVFCLLTTMARASALGIEGAVEPRYTTGSVLVWIGIALSLVLQSRGGHIVPATLFLIALTVFKVGSAVGLPYYLEKYYATQEIMKCVSEKGISFDGPCFALIKQRSLGLPTPELFSETVNLIREENARS